MSAGTALACIALVVTAATHEAAGADSPPTATAISCNAINGSTQIELAIQLDNPGSSPAEFTWSTPGSLQPGYGVAPGKTAMVGWRIAPGGSVQIQADATPRPDLVCPAQNPVIPPGTPPSATLTDVLCVSGGAGLYFNEFAGSNSTTFAVSLNGSVVAQGPVAAGDALTGFGNLVTDTVNTASVSVNGTVIATRTYHLPTDCPMTASWSGAATDGIYGKYKAKAVATNPKGRTHWSVQSGALPPGLKLTPGGIVTGAPTVLGSYTAVLLVQDASKPNPKLAAVRVSIDVTPMTVVSSQLPAATVGHGYTAKLDVNGGEGRHTWSLSTGPLPPGLKLSPAGKITGRPTAPGTYSFTVTVHDNAKPADTATGDLSITIS